MIDLITHNMAPLMFVGLIFGMIIGYPAAFSLAAIGLFFGLIGIELGLIRPDFLGNLTYQLFSVISNDLLLAIPFFTLMGAILERCGLAEDLLEGFGQLFGGLRGGLSYAVIVVGAVLGAITGTVAASVIAMGIIALPVMLKYGYSIRHATGVIAASGTVTQLVPPSLVLVVLADQLGRSVGDMYWRHRPEPHPDRAILRWVAIRQPHLAGSRAAAAAGGAHAAAAGRCSGNAPRA